MSKMKKVDSPARILAPSEYPASILAPRGAYPRDVQFVAEHPLGTYHVEHQGAGHLAAFFTAKRKGSRAKPIGAALSMEGAMRRISDHEDELVNPGAPREEGRNGPVSIYALGRRTGAPKTPSELDREIAAFLAKR